MSRSVPMDELLLQLVESLKQDHAPQRRRDLDGHRRPAVAQRCRCPTAAPATLRSRVRGGRRGRARRRAGQRVDAGVGARRCSRAASDRIVRIGLGRPPRRSARPDRARAPTATMPPSPRKTTEVLVELARQVGLALHNVRLDSALQASLDELKLRNEELVSVARRASSPPPTSRAARSNATCTTAPNSTWWRSR